jgi:hypothetical protein
MLCKTHHQCGLFLLELDSKCIEKGLVQVAKQQYSSHQGKSLHFFQMHLKFVHQEMMRWEMTR